MAEEAEKQSATVARIEPLRNYNFIVDFGISEKVLFTECSGLGARVTPIRFRAGGSAETVRYLAGQVDYSEAVFRYGVTKSAGALWDWFLESLRGEVKRREVSVVMLKADGVSPEFNINLSGAWITQLTTPTLQAAGSEAAIEEVRLIYEGIKRDAHAGN